MEAIKSWLEVFLLIHIDRWVGSQKKHLQWKRTGSQLHANGLYSRTKLNLLLFTKLLRKHSTLIWHCWTVKKKLMCPRVPNKSWSHFSVKKKLCQRPEHALTAEWNVSMGNFCTNLKGSGLIASCYSSLNSSTAHLLTLCIWGFLINKKKEKKINKLISWFHTWGVYFSIF